MKKAILINPVSIPHLEDVEIIESLIISWGEEKDSQLNPFDVCRNQWIALSNYCESDNLNVILCDVPPVLIASMMWVEAHFGTQGSFRNFHVGVLDKNQIIWF